MSIHLLAIQLRSLACCCNSQLFYKMEEHGKFHISLQSLLGSKMLYRQHAKTLNQWSKVPLRIWVSECKSPLLEKHPRI